MSIRALSSEDVESGRTGVAADVYAVERNDRFMEAMWSP
jgi:hypothetical protein